ncbi:hypothetical protein MOTT16_03065 [Moraxella osloensis]|uniref:RelA/SpoT domain-containing protein n=1 Tax=Faucicola osloensis TaxID=34062 RepID=A0AAD0ACT1_FAUOS|nr:hypothetical protein [Moraxella osloensis]ATQ82889.1 hypothetical protein YHS_03070 [Moraxella osloensis]ATW85389.1 hypothetical protein MOTT16_03065 [Moraxella osloensis]
MNNQNNYNIASEQEFIDAKMDKNVLNEIIDNYSLLLPRLKKTAAFYNDLLQDHPDINATKYRVKTPYSLGRKIIRKRVEANKDGKQSKYLNITIENYKSIVTDLIGIRVIYLFKHHWKAVNEHVLNTFNIDNDEDIVVYHGKCDDVNFYLKDMFDYRSKQYQYKHDSSKEPEYRSTHYLAFDSHNNIHFEIQTRTIFDDCWSEIDHTLRYPNNINNTLLANAMNELNEMVDNCQDRSTQAFELKGNYEDGRFGNYETHNVQESSINTELVNPIEHVGIDQLDTLKANKLQHDFFLAKRYLDMLPANDYQKLLASQVTSIGSNIAQQSNFNYSILETARKAFEQSPSYHRTVALQGGLDKIAKLYEENPHYAKSFAMQKALQQAEQFAKECQQSHIFKENLASQLGLLQFDSSNGVMKKK